MNRKFTWIGLVSVILTLLFTASAFALSLSTTDISLGSSNQEASNPKDDDGAKVIEVTGIVTFNDLTTLSSGAKTVTLNQVSAVSTKFVSDAVSTFSNVDAIATKLKSNPGLVVVDIDPNDNTIDNATDGTITIRTMIPATLDAIDPLTLDPAAFPVVTLTFNVGGVSVPGTVTLKMQRENELEIKNSDAEINSKEKQSVDDSDTIKNLKPGDTVDFDVEVENNFDQNSNAKIKKADLKLKCDNKDIDIDDESVDLGDVSEDDTETETLHFLVQEDAEDGNTGCDLTVSGKDINGALHGNGITFDIEVNRKNHDIQLKTVDATPSSLVCEDNNLQLSIGLLNLGNSDEDQVAVEVSSKALGLNQRIISNLQLDQDDTDVETATVAVDPKSMKSGTYAIQVQSFYDNVKVSDTQVIQIENTCTVKDDGSMPEGNGNVPTSTETLTLGQDTFKGGRGATVSIPVEITNSEDAPVEYTIGLANVDDFAEPAASKSVFLNPGQTSTIFINLKVKDNVADGKYSASVNLGMGSQTVETQTFTVDVAGQQAPTNTGSTTGMSANTSKVLWIIGDIVLVIIAIFFIRLIFMSGKTGKKDKKMADYEAESDKRRR